jgi:hypothetical protein
MTVNNQQKADKNRDIFREKAYALITEHESSLPELEEYPENHELIDNVFCASKKWALHSVNLSSARQ